MQFIARKPTGEIWNQGSSASGDLILTRILWLKGEEATNLSTYSRYIYFHGTNHEDKIGQPVSQGCIRMKNEDVVKLFDQVVVGTPVEILPDSAQRNNT